MTGSEILVKSLIAEKVDTIFGYPGGAIMPVYDELYKYSKEINHILVRHEQGAAHAAQGFARVSGKAGVVIVTSGPGATNIITGVADAMIDSTPLVVITGQIASSLLGTDAFQETDVVGITQPVTKWSYQIRRVEDIAWAVARAFYIARTGRPGPVVLDFAKNAQVGLSECFEYQPCNFIRSYDPLPEPEEQAVSHAAQILSEAQRPLVIIGQGVVLGHAEQEVITFIEKNNIPASFTLLGASALPSDHPLNFGMVGMHGHVAPNRKTQECDVLIALGMRFDDRVTGDLSTYAKQAKVIHFDIDPSEIGKNIKATAAVVGDVKMTLPLVAAAITSVPDRSSWVASFAPHVQEERERVINKELHPAAGQLTMGEVVNAVTDATGNKAILVTDVGQNQMFGARYFKFTQSRSMVTSGGLGTMGFGLPAAIGAKLGAPDRTVCFFCGDGGIQMTLQELGTIMQLGLDVKIILLNNNFLGMVRQWQELFYDERYSNTPMVNPQFTQIAAAYGIPSCEVNDREELAGAIEQMLAADHSFLLQVNVVNKGMVLPMIPAGADVTKIIFGDEK